LPTHRSNETSGLTNAERACSISNFQVSWGGRSQLPRSGKLPARSNSGSGNEGVACALWGLELSAVLRSNCVAKIAFGPGSGFGDFCQDKSYKKKKKNTFKPGS
jgi:hypothetical protein